MRVVIFCHSLRSDWNHGNAHFLRGVASELVARGHEVAVYEPEDAWSAEHLRRDHGEAALEDWETAYPELAAHVYRAPGPDLDDALANASLVLVHEWNAHDLVAGIGAHHRQHGGYVLLFHDTHHRCITARDEMAAYDLSGYDGVLAFGDVIRDAYLANGWSTAAWTWHEAADIRRFRPRPEIAADADLVWIGNWGDEERTAELRQFLIDPVRRLGLRATVFGVRYPQAAQGELAEAGITYGGWLPNYRVPEMFARHRLTVHVPRRPYLERLPGIPTIRPFEALACGIPLVCARWEQTGGLFTPGHDYLLARTGDEMAAHLSHLLDDASTRAALAAQGRETVLARHTCAHRVDELLAIAAAARSAEVTLSQELA